MVLNNSIIDTIGKGPSTYVLIPQGNQAQPNRAVGNIYIYYLLNF